MDREKQRKAKQSKNQRWWLIPVTPKLQKQEDHLKWVLVWVRVRLTQRDVRSMSYVGQSLESGWTVTVHELMTTAQ